MAKTHADRGAVISLHKSGHSPSQILKLLRKRVSRSFVYKTLKRFRETGSLNDRPRSGRPRTKSTSATIRRVKQLLRRNPRRSMKSMSKDLGVSPTTAFRIAKKYLGLKAYKKVQVQMLSAKDKDRRKAKASTLLKRFTDDEVDRIIFSDEKMFTVSERVNRQNDRVYAARKEDLPQAALKFRKAEFPAKIMVWGAVCSRGTLKLKFVDPGTKVNSDYYQNEILDPVLLPEARRLYPDGDWCFQQDGAPSHTSRTTQAWLRNHVPAFITKDEWPAKSPDLNPLDFSIWGMLEAKVNSRSHTSIDSLRKTIQREWSLLSADTVEKAVRVWRKRLRACRQAKGDHFEC